MDKSRRDTARERCGKATPGPWEEDINAVTSRGGMVCADFDWYADGEADKRFIAHARTDLPAALDYIDELEAKNQRDRADALNALDDRDMRIDELERALNVVLEKRDG